MISYIIAKGEFASAVLQIDEVSKHTRIVFLDSDNEFVNDWVVDEEDISVTIKEIQKGIELDNDKAVIKWLQECEPKRKIYTYNDDELKEYGDKYLNRIGHYYLTYED